MYNIGKLSRSDLNINGITAKILERREIIIFIIFRSVFVHMRFTQFQCYSLLVRMWEQRKAQTR